MFGFDYRIECYTPAARRRYGYFTLPILWRGQLIGRPSTLQGAPQGGPLRDQGAAPRARRAADRRAGKRPGGGAARECAAWHATPTVDMALSDLPRAGGLAAARS
ncbi:MAG: crosslink repair DNA glycosylase YcaQ family protein [Kouleothrix sp.]